MRPIDAIDRNKLREMVCAACNEMFSDNPCEPQDCPVLASIQAVPTLDVQPVRRGEWEICWGGVLCCTVCGKSADDFIGGLEGANYIEEPNFCPHCGADLRKEEHHE